MRYSIAQNYQKILLVQVAQSIRSFSSWAGEDVPHLQTNCEQQPEREMALFSFPHTSGGAELRGAPLVFIF